MVFCHIITNIGDVHCDICLLSHFVETLQSLINLSEAVGKLYQLCKAFVTIAKLCVSVRSSESVPRSSLDESSVNSAVQFTCGVDVDRYVSMLGSASSTTKGPSDDLLHNRLSGSEFADKWFETGASLMEILERDLEEEQSI